MSLPCNKMCQCTFVMTFTILPVSTVSFFFVFFFVSCFTLLFFSISKLKQQQQQFTTKKKKQEKKTTLQQLKQHCPGTGICLTCDTPGCLQTHPDCNSKSSRRDFIGRDQQFVADWLNCQENLWLSKFSLHCLSASSLLCQRYHYYWPKRLQCSFV